MFASKAPFLYVLQLVIVGLAVMIGIKVTGNALCILGLLLVWGAPPTIIDPNGRGAPKEDTEPEGRPMGFTAEMPQ